MATTNPFLQSPFQTLIAQQEEAKPLPGSDPVNDAALPDLSADPVPAQAGIAPKLAAPSPASLLPPENLRPLFEATAAHIKVPVNVLMAIAQQESSYNADAVNPASGAAGIVGYMDDTAKRLGINAHDPNEAVPAAAMQLRERLDKGYSVEDAVKEHFAGPDRKLWKDKTAAYGQEVLAKAGAIGKELYGDAADEAPAPAAPDLGPEQNQFSATRMRRPDYEKNFRAMNPRASQAAVDMAMAQYDKQVQEAGAARAKAKAAGPKPIPTSDEFFNERLNARLQGAQNGIVPQLPGHEQQDFSSTGTQHAKARPGVIDQARGDFGRGIDNLKALGYGAGGLAADAAGADDKADELLNHYVAIQNDIAKNNPATIGTYKNVHGLGDAGRYAIEAVMENLPMILPSLVTGGVGAKVAQAGAQRLVGGMIESQVAKGIAREVAEKNAAQFIAKRVMLGSAAGAAPATIGMESGSIMGDIYQDTGKKAAGTALAFGIPAGLLDTLEPVLALRKIAGPAVDAVAGGIIKRLGVEAGKQFITEAGTEGLQTVLEEAAKARAANKNLMTPALLDNVIDSMLKGGIGGAGMGVASQGVADARGALDTPERQIARAIQQQAAGAQFEQPAGQVALQRLDPNGGAAIDPRDTVRPPTPSASPAAPATPAGPLSAAVQAVAPTFQADGEGFAGQILGDDGQVHTIDSRTGVVMADEPAAPAGPMEAAIQDAADQHAANPAPLPAAPEQAPQPPALESLPLEDLRTQLKQVAAAAKANPEQRQQLMKQRQAIEKEIGARAKQAKADSKPAEEPLTTGPFDDIKAANRMMLRHAEATGQPHEVVGSEGKFTINPIGESNGINPAGAVRGPDGHGRSGQPADAVGRADPAAGGEAGRGAGGSERAAGSGPVANQLPDAGADRAAADGAAHAQPALTEPAPYHKVNPFHAYAFPDAARAEAFMDKKSVDREQFEAVQTGPVRWQVKPRAAPAQESFAQEVTADVPESPQVPEEAPVATGEKAAPRAVDAIAGKKINDEWTAFAKHSGTLNIDRAAMPQVKAEHRGALVNFLAARGIEHQQEETPASSLKPTQREFSPAKVEKARAHEGGDRSILVSSDGHVLDGHHQWLAKLNDNAPVAVIRLNAPIRELLDQVKEFPSAEVASGATKAKAEQPQPAAVTSPAPTQAEPEMKAPAKPKRKKAVPKVAEPVAEQDEGVRYSVSGDQTETPAFKRWFGKSAVVDASGKPRVMYHGTSKDFSEFNPGAGRDGRDAIFLTDDPKFADQYAGGEWTMAEGGAPNIMPVYVKAERPFDYDSAKDRAALLDMVFSSSKVRRALNGAGEMTIERDGGPSLYTRDVLDTGLASERNWTLIEQGWMQGAIRDAGFDGFYVAEDGRKNLAVYRPEQVKSAIGNFGSFDPASPDIRYSTASTLKDARTAAVKAAKEYDAYDKKVREDAKKGIEPDADEYFATSGAANESEAAFGAALAKIPDADFALEAKTPDGRTLMLNASAQKPGEWQLTRFGTDGAPWGDTQYPTKLQAIKDFLNESDLSTVNDFNGSIDPASAKYSTAHPMAKEPVRAISPLVQSLSDKGAIVLHQDASTLPVKGKIPSGVQALTTADGTIHVVANALGDNAVGIVLHEAFHAGTKALIGSSAWDGLNTRLGALYRQGEKSSGAARAFWDAAKSRVETAKAKGAVSPGMEHEEFGAYAIEEYAKAPASIRKWVDDLLGAVKAWALRRFGKQLGDVTPAELTSLAKLALLDAQAARSASPDLAPAFSADSAAPTVQVEGQRRPIQNSRGQVIAEDMHKQLAFYRWFGNSRVVDVKGRPRVVFHGTPKGEFSEFSLDKAGSNVDSGFLGQGFYFTNEADRASDYATKGAAEAPTTMPVYLSLQNPYQWGFKTRGVRGEVLNGTGIPKELKKAVYARAGFSFDPMVEPDFSFEPKLSAALREELIARGHDGVVAELPDGELEYVAFKPEQVKSAVGNDGSFSGDTPDIRYSVAGDSSVESHLRDALGVQVEVDSVDKNFGTGTHYNVKFSDATVQLSVREEPDSFYVINIHAKQPGDLTKQVRNTGRGREVMEALRAYSDATGKRLNIMGVTDGGEQFWRGLNWLKQQPVTLEMGGQVTTDQRAYVYEPQTPRYSVSGAPQPRVLTPDEQKLFRRVQAAVQDSMNRVRQVQDRIRESFGVKDLAGADYALAETNRPGRIAARKEDGRDKLIEPMMRRLAKAGYTPEQLSELLHAQHAEERNEAVARINPEFPDGGSGMKTKKAEQIIARYANEPALLALADEARQIARETLEMKRAYGLITQAQYDALATSYANYVPLKGDGEYGPKVKRAMGHGDREEHIIENIARDFEQAIVVGEKNLARQSLLQMVLQYPDDGLWTARVPPKGRYVAGTVFEISPVGTRNVEASFTSQSQVAAWLEGKGAAAAGYEVNTSGGERVTEFTKPLQDNEVMVYVKGSPVRIQIFDEVLARQLRPLHTEMMNTVLGLMQKHNRYLSTIYTGYNPAFILKNATRDAITGSINMTGNHGAVTAAKAWARYPAAWATLLKWAVTKDIPAGPMGDALREYRAQGGKVGASYMSDLEEQGKSLQRMFDDQRGFLKTAMDVHPGESRTWRAGFTKSNERRATAVAAGKTIGKLAHVIEVLNQAFENALRLALFAQLRAEGKKPGHAAQAAKTVTVNFDRKGTATPYLGAFYLFINPAIQGTANLTTTLTRGEHKSQAWALVGMMAAAGFAAAIHGMDDDKDRWLGEKWDTRTKNLRIRVGSHTLNVPLSQEYAPFYAVGVAMGEVRRGESSLRASAHVLSSFLDAYYPMQGAIQPGSDNYGLDLLLAHVPTVGKMAAQIAANRNSFGNKIVPESDNTKNRPDNLKMYRGTKNSAYDASAQGIAAAGQALGADKYGNDLSKVSPETLKLIWSTYTGGLGKFVADSAGLGAMAVQGSSQIEVGDMPVVKDFVKADKMLPLRSRYFDLSRQAQDAIDQFGAAKKQHDAAEMQRIAGDPAKRAVLGLGKMVSAVNKIEAAYADMAVSINADKTLGPADKRARLKELEDKQEAIYRKAIAAFKK